VSNAALNRSAVKTDKPALGFEMAGRADRPALLLLHGFMSSNLQWEPNLDGLQARFRWVAVELWGHGHSPVPSGPAPYRVQAYLAQFEALREQLGVARWFVCGQSFGAGIMMRYALERPDVVQGLIMTNSRSVLNNVVPEDGPGLDLKSWQELDRHLIPYHPCHANRIPEALRKRMEDAADRITPYALWQAVETTARELSCREEAAEIAVPTLVINGRREAAFQHDRDFLAATVPGVCIVDLDAGHSVNIEVPTAFNEAVIDFAGDHS
jgi:pimeloyl-ACP methyl ester carboxylesterase